MLHFTKGIGKRNFLDVMIKNYIPRVYHTVERLNVRYLSSEEMNIGRSDQENRVYKENKLIEKIWERKEKIGVKVVGVKVKTEKEKRKKKKRKGNRKGINRRKKGNRKEKGRMRVGITEGIMM